MKIRSCALRSFQYGKPGAYFRGIFSVVLALMTGTVLCYVPVGLGAPENSSRAVPTPPHYREILKIIRPLNYSGFYILQKPGVTLSVDFKDRTWTLHGIRRYAPDGTLLLDEGRNGLCAELTYHTFQKIKPLLDARWKIKFARATEPGFFSAAESNHVVLILGDPVTQATYLLDPSFHRYGPTPGFPQYTILGAKDGLPSFEQRDPDATLPVNDSFPLLIRKDFLILLSVESVDGSLDPENLALAVSSRHRAKASNNYLMALRKQNGEIRWLRDEDAMKKLFSPEEMDGIRKKLVEWAGTL